MYQQNHFTSTLIALLLEPCLLTHFVVVTSTHLLANLNLLWPFRSEENVCPLPFLEMVAQSVCACLRQKFLEMDVLLRTLPLVSFLIPSTWVTDNFSRISNSLNFSWFFRSRSCSWNSRRFNSSRFASTGGAMSHLVHLQVPVLCRPSIPILAFEVLPSLWYW